MRDGRTQALIVAAAGGSALLLAGAFAFQDIGGLAPCQLCLWQRWPHGAAVLVGVVWYAFVLVASTARAAGCGIGQVIGAFAVAAPALFLLAAGAVAAGLADG